MTERSIELPDHSELTSPENLEALHQAANLLGTSPVAEVEHIHQGKAAGTVWLAVDACNGDTLIEITDQHAPLELQYDENATRMPRMIGAGIQLRLTHPDRDLPGSPLFRTFVAPDQEQALALARYLERVRTSSEYRFVRHAATPSSAQDRSGRS